MQDCIRYSSILNPFCTLSLPFHDIPWSLPHIWICPFLFSSSLAFHLTGGAHIFTQSAIGRHKLFLSCCSHSTTTVKLLVQMSRARHQLYLTGAQILRMDLRVREMHWLFLLNVEHSPKISREQGLSWIISRYTKCLIPHLPIWTGIRNHYHPPRQF